MLDLQLFAQVIKYFVPHQVAGILYQPEDGIADLIHIKHCVVGCHTRPRLGYSITSATHYMFRREIIAIGCTSVAGIRADSFLGYRTLLLNLTLKFFGHVSMFSFLQHIYRIILSTTTPVFGNFSQGSKASFVRKFAPDSMKWNGMNTRPLYLVVTCASISMVPLREVTFTFSPFFSQAFGIPD